MKAHDLVPAARAISEAGGLTIGATIGVPAAVALGAVLTTFRWALNSVNTALIFMILVVVIAAIGGRLAGVITVVASAVSYDFFHTEPYLSMAIESRDDIETTGLLLVAGVLVGAVATAGNIARRRENAARSEVQRIHRVGDAAASGWPTAVVLAIAQDEIKDLLDLAECRFETLPYTDNARRPPLGRNGTIELQSSFRFHRDREGRPGFELPRTGVDLKVLARGHNIGRFVLVPNPRTGTSVHNRLVAVAIADQVAAVWTVQPSQHDDSPG